MEVPLTQAGWTTSTGIPTAGLHGVYGLQSVRQGLPLDKMSALEEFIETNVYGKLSDTLKKVLLKLSLFGEFPVGMAMWVLEEKEEQQCFKKLMSSKTFLALDERSGNYRMQGLLEAFWRTRGQWEAFSARAVQPGGRMVYPLRQLQKGLLSTTAGRGMWKRS